MIITGSQTVIQNHNFGLGTGNDDMLSEVKKNDILKFSVIKMSLAPW